MKILLLSQFFSTTKGGGEYVFSMMAKALAESDNSVWVITNQIKNEEYMSHKNIHIVFVPPLLEYRGGLPPGFYDNIRYALGTIRRGFSIIKSENIDIIHSNNFSPALAGSVLSTLTLKPHITTVHDIFSLCGEKYWELWGKQNGVSRFNVLLAPFFEKMMIKLKHNAIHTVSKATKDDLIKFGSKKPIYVIPNAIEIKNIRESNSMPFQFIYIGRLVFYKNLEVVIKAVSIVKKSYPQVTLVIVGDGPHGRNLEKLVASLNLQENIKFTGYISTNEKVELLSKSIALVFPSLCEGFGLVILEAFAQKKPVLVSNIPPLSDIVIDKINGFLISPHHEEKWAEKMIEIIKTPGNAWNMGISGWKTLVENYTIKEMQDKILKMYNNVLMKS